LSLIITVVWNKIELLNYLFAKSVLKWLYFYSSFLLGIFETIRISQLVRFFCMDKLQLYDTF